MPAPVHAQRSRTVRRLLPIRQRAQRKIVHLVRKSYRIPLTYAVARAFTYPFRRRRRSRSPSSSRSRSSRSSNSSGSSQSSTRERTPSQKRRASRNSRRRSTFVMPLYGTNGTVIVGYVRPCRAGVRLWYSIY
uniref:P3 n=1 Tax=Elaeophora elaphi TaxID=1147741 RepID=A0A0R3RM38_9BILA